jgi:hypothetical protein
MFSFKDILRRGPEMRTLSRTLVAGVILTGIAGCLFDSKDDDTGSMTPPISIGLSATRQPAYMDTTTITCKYSVDYPEDRADKRTFVARGRFYLDRATPAFIAVEGESSWVDTVTSYEARSHAVVLKALKRGWFPFEAVVSCTVDTFVTYSRSTGLMISVK